VTLPRRRDDPVPPKDRKSKPHTVDLTIPERTLTIVIAVLSVPVFFSQCTLVSAMLAGATKE
jgi:hypothetical protein